MSLLLEAWLDQPGILVEIEVSGSNLAYWKRICIFNKIPECSVCTFKIQKYRSRHQAVIINNNK